MFRFKEGFAMMGLAPIRGATPERARRKRRECRKGLIVEKRYCASDGEGDAGEEQMNSDQAVDLYTSAILRWYRYNGFAL